MANLIYVNEATAITWLDTGGTAVLTLTSVAAGAGRQGALHDLGVAARSREYAWRAYLQMATTPVVGEIIDIYLKFSDGTHPDNDDGTGDLDVSAEDKLRNLHWIGKIVIDEAVANLEFTGSGVIEVDHRYVAPVFFNRTADALTSTAAEHGFIMTPVPSEVQ